MAKLTKEEKAKLKAEKKAKGEGLWADFKKFISRGSVLDMSVGVIMGSAFSAIVTAFTNILLSVCMWGVPGGINGLVTVLPALNDAQRGMDASIGLGQKFDATELQSLATKLAEQNYASYIADDSAYLTNNPNLIESTKSTILSKYTLHGTTYTYNLSAVIDWGTFINAIISFIIIALTLFTIVKVYSSLQKARKDFESELKGKIERKEAEPAQAE